MFLNSSGYVNKGIILFSEQYKLLCDHIEQMAVEWISKTI